MVRSAPDVILLQKRTWEMYRPRVDTSTNKYQRSLDPKFDRMLDERTVLLFQNGYSQMLLDLHDLDQFFRLHRTLMHFVNQQLQVLPGDIATPEDFAILPTDTRLEVHKALSGNINLIDSFVERNPARLPDDELDIVRSWRHLIAGSFRAIAST